MEVIEVLLNHHMNVGEGQFWEIEGMNEKISTFRVPVLSTCTAPGVKGKISHKEAIRAHYYRYDIHLTHTEGFRRSVEE